jgi:hypothetical protein
MHRAVSEVRTMLASMHRASDSKVDLRFWSEFDAPFIEQRIV